MTEQKKKVSEIRCPDGWERKDVFERVELNQYGYYQLKYMKRIIPDTLTERGWRRVG